MGYSGVAVRKSVRENTEKGGSALGKLVPISLTFRESTKTIIIRLCLDQLFLLLFNLYLPSHFFLQNIVLRLLLLHTVDPISRLLDDFLQHRRGLLIRALILRDLESMNAHTSIAEKIIICLCSIRDDLIELGHEGL